MTENVEAVALWIPPGLPEMSPADAERFPSVVADACGEASATRVLELMAGFERTHPHEPMHFYLSLLGTHPDHRGEGIGIALLAACLEQIDAEAAPAYLESSNPVNLPRYERLGFEVWRADTELIPGISATQMWRSGTGTAGGPISSP